MSIIIAGVFPLLNDWIEKPEPPQVTGVTNELENILPRATDFLAKLPQPTDGIEPCNSGSKHRRDEETRLDVHKRNLLGGLFKTAFSLLTCVIDTTNKIKDGVVKEAVENVKSLQEDLRPLLDALKEVDEDEPGSSTSKLDQPSSTQPPSSTPSGSASSSSCSLNTVSNCKVQCTATATTTIGGAQRRADGEACSTTCDSPITKCGATGATSVSTVTSTTTNVQMCGKSCPSCNGSKPSPRPFTNSNLMTASDGLVYLPASTVSVAPTEGGFGARDVGPRETSAFADNIQKRALTNPNQLGMDVGQWLLDVISQGEVKILTDGEEQEGFLTTALTGQLSNRANSFAVGNLWGCTVVVVTSRKRIYMAHIWEEDTMAKSDIDFQRDAIDIFVNTGGDGAGVTEGISAFTGPGGDFENVAENHVRAMVSKLNHPSDGTCEVYR
jgi:hypothetical protein